LLTVLQLFIAVYRQTTILFADSQATKKFRGIVAFVPTVFLAEQSRTDRQRKNKTPSRKTISFSRAEKQKKCSLDSNSCSDNLFIGTDKKNNERPTAGWRNGG
jgi:hypothetical protein